MARITLVLVLALFSGLTAGGAHAHGIRYWLYGGTEVQLVGLRLYTPKNAPDTKVCAVYMGTLEAYKGGRKPLVDLADLLFEQYIGQACLNHASKITIFAGPKVVTVRSESTIGKGDIAAGNTWVGKLVDDEREQESNVVPISAYDGGLSRELCEERNSTVIPMCEMRIDYVAAKPGLYERMNHKQVPVLPSPFVQNPAGTPTEVAPGVTIAVEGVFELNPDNASKPFGVVLYRTAVPITDTRASDELGKLVAQALLGDKLKSRALTGASVVAHNEPPLGRLHVRQRKLYAEFPK